MEVVLFALGFFCGALAVKLWLREKPGKAREFPGSGDGETGEDPSSDSIQRMQWENFWRYDGTKRGQNRWEE